MEKARGGKIEDSLNLISLHACEDYEDDLELRRKVTLEKENYLNNSTVHTAVLD